MADNGVKPIRRVVTGNDANGKSKVIWDDPAPNARPGPVPGSGWTSFWVWNETPAPLSGTTDDGGMKYDFPGPMLGGHWSVLQSVGKPVDYDASKDTHIVKPHAPVEHKLARRWERGGNAYYQGGMHKTETVDYIILIAGSRTLVLDDCEVEWKPGDVIIDVGAWHQWSSRTPEGGSFAGNMIAAKFVDGPVGLAQGNDKILVGDPKRQLPPGVKPARRIVCIDREPYKSTLVSDGPTPDVRLDPMRPGYASQRMWVTDSSPAKIVLETLHLPHTIEAPPGGSVLNSVTFPPDAVWEGKVSEADVKAFFKMMGSPGASTYSAVTPHPYMQKTNTLEFGIVTEGEIVLVLDTQEVILKQGDFIVQRGTNHAWSNRSGKPATVIIATHDGKA
jgi:uncharacterized cupin superfamily protein